METPDPLMSMIPIDSPLLAAYLASESPIKGMDEAESNGTGPTAASSRSESNGNGSGFPHELQYLATHYHHNSPAAKQNFHLPESISENRDGNDEESENDDCESAYLSALACLAPAPETNDPASSSTNSREKEFQNEKQSNVSQSSIEASKDEDDQRNSSDDSDSDGCEEAYLSAIALLDPKNATYNAAPPSQPEEAPRISTSSSSTLPVDRHAPQTPQRNLPLEQDQVQSTPQQESDAGGFSWWNRWTFRDTPPTEGAMNSIEDIMNETNLKEEQSNDTGSMDAQSWCTDPSLSIASSVMTAQSILSTSSATVPIREAIVPSRNPNRYADLKASFKRRQRELLLQQRMYAPDRNVEFAVDHFEYRESPPLYDDEMENYWYTASDYKFFQQELWAAASPYMREIIPIFAQAFRFFCQPRRSRHELRRTQGRLEEIYSYFDGHNYCIDDSVMIVGLEHILWTCARGEPKKTVEFILDKQRLFRKSSSVRNPITALAKECKVTNQPTKLLAQEMAMALARTLDGDEDEEEDEENMGPLDSDDEDSRERTVS